MADFAIVSPKMGVREDIPSILLDEAFMGAESRNVHRRFGKYRTMLGRLKYLLDANDVQISCPTNIYTITAIDAGNKKLTVTGDVTAVISDGDSIRINGGTTAANNALFTVNGTPTYSSPSSTIYVTETISAAGATPGNVFYGSTTVLAVHRHIKQSTSAEYFLVATAYNIFLWNHTAKSLTVKFTCASPGTVYRWEILTHLDNVYATNDSDKVLVWDVHTSPSGNFVALGDVTNGLDLDGGATYLTKAKHIGSYESYLFVGYTTEGGTVYPQRIRWSSRSDPTDFDDTGAGDTSYKDFNNTEDFLMGFAKSGNDIIVAKQEHMMRGWLVTEDTVFNWIEERLKVGCLSAHTLINDKAGRLYWLAHDMTIRELNTPDPIADAVDITVRGINTSVVEYAQASWIDEFSEIWFAVPTGSSTTNDKILSVNINDKTWQVHNIPVRCFGDYTAQEIYTYDTLPYANYNEWGAAWGKYDTSVNVLGFPLDMAGGYDGKVYNLHASITDAGVNFTHTMIFSTTLFPKKGGLGNFKRINNGIYFYFDRQSAGTVSVYYKKDTEKSWQSLDDVSLADTDLPEVVVVHVPCDIRAKNFQFKLEGTDYFEFLGMLFPEFEVEGVR